MGVLRTRVGPVGCPFKKGNPGGGRPKGVPNKATREIKEFARTFLESPRYRQSLQRRIVAGKAPHMEILLHHYAFGKPTARVEVAQSPPSSSGRKVLVQAIERSLTSEERVTYARLSHKVMKATEAIEMEAARQTEDGHI